jgi:FlaA1/EpsC-like NDP-sugar epimerase
VVADVTDEARLARVFATHRPEIVFHAAAHKHVPLMERSPGEAVKNNVGGTRLVAEMAAGFGASHVILISTDKAVNPTSVMGASKRVAERVALSLMDGGPTVFAAVRFGNVLGSNGSVVPLFRQQIARGQPVTITDPDMRRYFMLIPEAVQLVLHAASLARGGELFVLEMGEQVKIVDMARTLIRLSGLRPEIDVPLVFTGARPGEKLFEELVEAGEHAEPSGVPFVTRVRPRPVADRAALTAQIAALEAAAAAEDDRRTLDLLVGLVPTFTPHRPSAEPRPTSAAGDAAGDPTHASASHVSPLAPRPSLN